MLSKIIFKRLLPATAIYYVSLQVYLVDHILRSGQTRIIPEAVALSNKTLAEREKILLDFFDIVQLIDMSPEKFDCFIENAALEDPSIRFGGKAAIKNGLYFMNSVIQKSETLKMEVTHTKSKIFVDSEQRFTCRGMQATIPQLVTLELVKDDEGNEKIARATEEWNSKPLLDHENAPILFVGLALSYIRGMAGKMVEFIPVTPPSS